MKKGSNYCIGKLEMKYLWLRILYICKWILVNEIWKLELFCKNNS